MAAEPRYTTQFQAGLGMIPETIDLLRFWQPGMKPARLAERVLEEGVFSRATARRSRNLVAEMFAPRFLVADGMVAERLKFLLKHQLAHEAFVQLCFLYTARAQRILADFVLETYWPKYAAGGASVTRDDAENFVHRALDEGRMASRWSSSTIKRVSGYLLGCCADFGLLGDGAKGVRPILRFSIRQETALYLSHDLHFCSISDGALVNHPDWRLFGYEPVEVLNRLKTVAGDGHFFVQSSGELLQISWKYREMNDCLHALTHP